MLRLSVGELWDSSLPLVWMRWLSLLVPWILLTLFTCKDEVPFVYPFDVGVTTGAGVVATIVGFCLFVRR
jgi:hypothetical protein